MAREKQLQGVYASVGSGYGGSVVVTGSGADSFDALLKELAGELDDTHPALADLGRFTVEGTLGAGGFGSVYAAVDTQDDRPVALKVLRRGSADALLRFKREFRSLADVRHRNLVRLYELLQVGDKWLLSMERVQGQPFDVWVGRHPERLEAVMGQLVEGVAALHGAGKLHRDLKPSNVLVEDGGRVVILDFGLIRERADDGSTVLAGTPAYMSPEQCAEGELGPASDWYAVGVMLYQVLSGRLPFEGTMLEVLRQKQEHDVPALQEGGELAELAGRLLARDPEARPTGAELLGRFATEEAPATSRGTEPREAFVGREAELAQLEGELETVKGGQPRSVFVRGVSGMGKSALVGCFAARARGQGAVVLQGRCYERETVPFKAVDGLVDALCLYLRRLSRVEAVRVLPRGIHALARLFPVLNAVEALDDVPRQKEVDDGPEQRRRGFVALKELLGAIADGRPVVVALDDLQWGDEDSARLLAELLGPPGPPCMLFLGAFRSEEAEQSVLLRELKRTFEADVELAVEALSMEAATALAEQLLAGRCDIAMSHRECADDRTAEAEAEAEGEAEADSEVRALSVRLAQESEGHPLFLRQLVQHGGEGKAVTLDSVLRARLDALPEAQRAALDLIALAGRPTPVAVLADAVELPDGAVLRDTLDALRSDAWTRVSHRVDTVECFHDRIRETVAGELSESRTRHLHRRLAYALAAHDGPPDAIAESFLATGDEHRAAAYAVRAAEQAEHALAFDQAVRWYREALRLDGHGPQAAGHEARLAEALASAGRGGEAAAAFQRLAVHASGLEAQRLRQRAAIEYLGAGHYEEGAAILHPLLAELGRPIPKSTPGRVGLLAARTAWSALRPAVPKPPYASPSARDRLCFETLLQASYATPNYDVVFSLTLGAESGALAASRGDAHMAAEGAMAQAFQVRPLAASTKQAWHHLAKIASSLPDGYPKIRMLSSEGSVLLLSGDFGPAADALSRVAAALGTHAASAHAHRDFIDQFHALALWRCGRWREVEAVEEARLRRAIAHGRPFPERYAHMGLAACALVKDQPGVSKAHLGRVQGDFPMVEVTLACFSAMVALYEHSAEAAHQPRSTHRQYERQIDSVPMLRADVGTFAPLIDLAFWQGDRRTLKQVERRATKIGNVPVLFAPAQAAALRAGVAARRKQFAKAERLFDDAIAGFDRASMKMHAAACRMRRGEILGGDEGRALIAAGEACMREEGVVKPEQFAQCYAPRFPLR